jgi:DNA-binding GntR family transcriptional regulator
MTSTQKLYGELKHDIVTCALPPGKSFSEEELGQRYRTSRTPVREVCRHLAIEGLMNIIPFRGYFVAPLTVGEFGNLQEVQLMVDPSAAGLAAERASAQQIEDLEKWARYKYKGRESYYEFLDQNRSLHVGIAGASGNDRLVEIVSNVHTRLMRYFYLGLSMHSFGDEIVKEHRAIVDAIRKRRAPEARKRTREHIENTMRRSAALWTTPGIRGYIAFDVANGAFGPGLNHGLESVKESPSRPQTARKRVINKKKTRAELIPEVRGL